MPGAQKGQKRALDPRGTEVTGGCEHTWGVVVKAASLFFVFVFQCKFMLVPATGCLAFYMGAWVQTL